MKTRKKLFKQAIKFLPLFIVGLFLSNLVLARTAESLGPQFNSFPNDPKTLRVANSSRQTNWQGETEAVANETVAFLFYYHNGIENTIAENTRLHVSLPQNSNQPIIATGYLWANNTAKTVIDKVTIKTNEPLKIEYISGTTKWYKEGSQTAINLPDGISSANGISIGNIKGCWPYAGYVVFQAKLTSPAKPNLAIEKKVANFTKDANSYNWQKQVFAQTGEEVAFSLFIYNPGNAKINQVKVSDSLPSGLVYINGSTMIYRGSEKSNLSDGITSSGININNLEPGINNGFYITFKTKVIASGIQKLTNCANAKYDYLYVKDYAYVNISEQQIPNISLEKKVRNVSKKQNFFSESVNANSRDIIEFRIITRNTGNTNLNNIILTDILPDGLIFQSASFLTQSDSTINWHWNSLAKGANQTVYVKAKVKDLSPGDYRFINTAKVKANSLTELIDEACVNVKVLPPKPLVAKYYLDKKVLNVSKKDNLWLENNEAYAGDILEYKIYFKNIGEKTEKIKLTDDLPQAVTYVPDSGRVKVANKIYPFSQKFFSIEGLSFNLAPNQEGIINFRVKILSGLTAGTSFENTAYLIAPSATLNDYVITKIKIKPVIKPEKPAKTVIAKQVTIQKPQVLPATGAWTLFPASFIFALANYIWFEKTKGSLK